MQSLLLSLNSLIFLFPITTYAYEEKLHSKDIIFKVFEIKCLKTSLQISVMEVSTSSSLLCCKIYLTQKLYIALIFSFQTFWGLLLVIVSCSKSHPEK